MLAFCSTAPEKQEDVHHFRSSVGLSSDPWLLNSYSRWNLTMSHWKRRCLENHHFHFPLVKGYRCQAQNEIDHIPRLQEIRTFWTLIRR